MNNNGKKLPPRPGFLPPPPPPPASSSRHPEQDEKVVEEENRTVALAQVVDSVQLMKQAVVQDNDDRKEEEEEEDDDEDESEWTYETETEEEEDEEVIEQGATGKEDPTVSRINGYCKEQEEKETGDKKCSLSDELQREKKEVHAYERNGAEEKESEDGDGDEDEDEDEEDWEYEDEEETGEESEDASSLEKEEGEVEEDTSTAWQSDEKLVKQVTQSDEDASKEAVISNGAGVHEGEREDDNDTDDDDDDEDDDEEDDDDSEEECESDQDKSREDEAREDNCSTDANSHVVTKDEKERKTSDAASEASSSAASSSAKKLMTDDQLEDMLTRIKRLREERKRILDDMKAMKAAFKDEEEEEEEDHRGPVDEESGGNEALPSIKPIAPIRVKTAATVDGDSSPSSPSAEAAAGVRCFICGFDFGPRLNKGATMHMGLQDGDPICPRALYLTEASRGKIRGVAASETMTAQEKYDLLHLSPLAESGVEGSGREWAESADSFLEDMEARRAKDKEEQEAVRTGALQVQATTTAALPEEEHSEAVDDSEAVGDSEADSDAELAHAHEEDETSSPSNEMSELRSRLLEELSSPSPLDRLSRPPVFDDRSESATRGKVLRTDLAPTVGVSAFRTLLRQISDENGERVRRRLRRVATSDRSAPYLPPDMEVFCVGDLPKWDREREERRRDEEARERARWERRVGRVALPMSCGELQVCFARVEVSFVAVELG